MKILYVLLFVMFSACQLFAQQNIVRSTEKVRVDGKVYYTHPVKKKETLYSLSKAYDVTINEILQHNQHAATGLKVGMLLYIPVNDAITETGVSSTAADNTATAVKNTDKAGLGNNQQVIDTKKYRKHTVKWFEDITSISEKYNVPVEALVAINNLKEGKLKSRQVLLIPDNDYIAALGDTTADNATQQTDDANAAGISKSEGLTAEELLAKDENRPQIDTNNVNPWGYTNTELAQGLQRRNWNEPIEIAYILPLNSRDTSNVNSSFMDFYAGALLAINDSKNNGAEIKVNIYDQNDYMPLHALIDEPGFDRNQLIIGPVRHNDLVNFTGYSFQKQIPLISPLDNNAESMADENRYFVQMPANANAQINNTMKLLEEVMVADTVSTILLISEKGSNSDSLYVNSAKRYLNNKGIEYKEVTYGILEGRDVYTTMLSLVDTLSTNPHIALIPSNSEAFVSDVVRNLDLCTKPGAQITLFGLPKWRNFETINVELFHKMKLHISLPYFVDYKNEVVKRFLLQYRALYSAEPTPFAYQGYDITRYLLDQMQQYGNSFINAVSLPRTTLLQSDFELYREDGGLKNGATRNIVYKPDFTIEVIR